MHRWMVAMIMYVFIVLLILAVRPALMFDEHGQPKPFGVGMDDGHHTVFALSIMFPILALVCFVISAVVDLASS